jgi:hypothetical protein
LFEIKSAIADLYFYFYLNKWRMTSFNNYLESILIMLYLTSEKFKVSRVQKASAFINDAAAALVHFKVFDVISGPDHLRSKD